MPCFPAKKGQEPKVRDQVLPFLCTNVEWLGLFLNSLVNGEKRLVAKPRPSSRQGKRHRNFALHDWDLQTNASFPPFGSTRLGLPRRPLARHAPAERLEPWEPPTRPRRFAFTYLSMYDARERVDTADLFTLVSYWTSHHFLRVGERRMNGHATQPQPNCDLGFPPPSAESHRTFACWMVLVVLISAPSVASSWQVTCCAIGAHLQLSVSPRDSTATGHPPASPRAFFETWLPITIHEPRWYLRLHGHVDEARPSPTSSAMSTRRECLQSLQSVWYIRRLKRAKDHILTRPILAIHVHCHSPSISLPPQPILSLVICRNLIRVRLTREGPSDLISREPYPLLNPHTLCAYPGTAGLGGGGTTVSLPWQSIMGVYGGSIPPNPVCYTSSSLGVWAKAQEPVLERSGFGFHRIWHDQLRECQAGTETSSQGWRYTHATKQECMLFLVDFTEVVTGVGHPFPFPIPQLGVTRGPNHTVEITLSYGESYGEDSRGRKHIHLSVSKLPFLSSSPSGVNFRYKVWSGDIHVQCPTTVKWDS
ncbi:hypothetical protein ACRALDRAFT_211763 [Sodiomyces alcalophilus JCM 7366]|uniref:uncharacterized protein n=1 Tax=Sodiomyces alcalophilus JCM 7366 TaxID=591952 RepID=UPI0039B3B787